MIAINAAPVLLALRVWIVVTGHIDSDESQHLHAAWLVASGRVPYRDFWENHAPLLYYLFAPLTRWYADQPAIYMVGRVLMSLLALLTLALVYRLARRTEARVAGLAVLLLAVQSRFAEYTTQVRPDVPGVIAWLATLLALVRWREKGRSAWLWLAGFTLGVYGTFPPQAVHGPVGVTVFVVLVSWSEGRRLSRSTGALTRLVASASVPLLGVLGWLWMTGGSAALAGFLRDVVVGNLRFPDMTRQLPDGDEGLLIYALGILGAGLVIRRHGRAVLRSPLHGPLVLTAGVIGAILTAPLTPAVYRYTWLPVLVIAAVYASVALIAGLDSAWARRGPLLKIAAALGLVGIVTLPVGASVLNLRRDEHKNARLLARMRTELAYACPGEPVLDGTALAVFRPSASRFEVLVRGLRSAIAAGVISEQTLVQDFYHARAPVADLDRRLHAVGPAVEAFLATYYGTGPNGLRLAGTTLEVPKDPASGRRSITLLMAGPYQVAVSPGITFTIDGAAVQGDRVVLEAGRHDLAWQGAGGTISLLIAPCAERRGSHSPATS